MVHFVLGINQRFILLRTLINGFPFIETALCFIIQSRGFCPVVGLNETSFQNLKLCYIHLSTCIDLFPSCQRPSVLKSHTIEWSFIQVLLQYDALLCREEGPRMHVYLRRFGALRISSAVCLILPE